MKLSKKIMLFEEFSDIKGEVEATTAEAPSIRTEIANDCDAILKDLEALASNLGPDGLVANESEVLNEGDLVGSLMSAELYMIPVILAGGAAATGAAAGLGIFALIKNLKNKKKIRKEYAAVHDTKMNAAEIEVGLTKLKGGDEKQQKKAQALKAKGEKLTKTAEEVDGKLGERWEKYKDFLAKLRSQTQMDVAQLMLKGDLSDSQRARFEEQLQNAEEDLNSAIEAQNSANQEAEKGLGTEEEQIKKIEEEKEKLKEKLDAATTDEDKEQYQNAIKMADDRIAKLKGEKVEPTEPTETEDDTPEEVDKTDNSKDGMLKRIDALIKKAEESGDEAKIEKAKALKAKIEAKESIYLKYTKDGALLESELIELETEYLV